MRGMLWLNTSLKRDTVIFLLSAGETPEHMSVLSVIIRSVGVKVQALIFSEVPR